MKRNTTITLSAYVANDNIGQNEALALTSINTIHRLTTSGLSPDDSPARIDGGLLMALFRNKKNGNLYFTLGTVTNATNAQDDQEMILYQPVESQRLFCREETEFNQKFERVKSDEIVKLLGPIQQKSTEQDTPER
ncbi:hypothetical protein GM415_15975 [Pseudodesulfovibrio cashew]|uniref:Uncharacterized protein n=1 Tax=Pseudodesulfovibrio cashew TaxID=2678688 RepID=A0A6I6JV04_9BACT|nr:hypothetical protein [Pseudodesulfovibrio cashew]QGY41554.1 hypothetical protein GM415_15975 [Pseudodesulfovibrio cashew]